MDDLFFCVGISHKTASLSFREKFHLSATKIASIIPAIKDKFAYRELVILSTCNRCELYGVTDKDDDFAAAFVAVHDQLGIDYTATEIKEKLYVLKGWQAVKHILTTVAGMDSLIMGETQIVGQVKQAFTLAQQAQTSGPILHRILQTALATSGRIRSQTEIGCKTVSISHAAIVLAQKIFSDISKVNMLIVGAGEMATIAAKHACKHRVERLAIINRNVERAEQLRQKVGRGTASDLSDLDHFLAWADVVITATTATDFIIDRDAVIRAQRERRNKPMGFIDISLPRNIDPDCQHIEDIYLFDLDDLKQLTDYNLAARQQSSVQALAFVEQGVKALQKTFIAREVGLTVAGFKSFLHDLVRNQTDQTLAKSMFGTLTPQQREGIHKLSEIIVNKIVGRVSVQLKDASSEQEQLLTVFRNLYQDANSK